MLLWKYLSPHRIDVLQTGLIRWAPPSRTNDPFEALPILASLNLRRPDNDKPMSIKVGSYYSVEISGVQYSMSYADLRDALVTFRDSVGMLCLCEVSDHPLMWAHYAQDHTGFVVEFDCEHAYFTDTEKRLEFRQVSYLDRRQSLLDLAAHERDGALHSSATMNFMSMYFAKHSTWSYEREWRVLRKLPDTPDNPNFLFPYPRESIKRVIIGCHMEEISRQRIVSLIKTEPALAHVKIAYAVPNMTTFGIDVWDKLPTETFTFVVDAQIKLESFKGFFSKEKLPSFELAHLKLPLLKPLKD